MKPQPFSIYYEKFSLAPFILIARKGHFRGTATEVAFSLDDTMSSYLTS